MVYIQDFGKRGRNKIQDVWNSVVHRVVKAPREGGAVYSVVPVHEPDKVKHVHWPLLKAQNQGALPEQTQEDSSPEQQVVVQEEELEEADWLLVGSREHQAPVVLCPEEPGGEELPSAGVVVLELQAPVAPRPEEPGCVEFSASLEVPMGRAPSVPIGPESGAQSVSEVPVGTGVLNHFSVEEDGARRSRRTTAGYHPNIHRLPRAVGHSASDAPIGSSAVTVLFRPWN
ncbi:uncharacterized protein LOC125252363 [Megalobrama amblycephala]|uniref:uncharacterized protein LOC125252363 n=1 Tax=Megalobrama amblycephala TaxID=75352 RepID=UPI00201470CB|nr:uncharacterized protein LOC125252363 [Megalobrama amblycephala]